MQLHYLRALSVQWGGLCAVRVQFVCGLCAANCVQFVCSLCAALQGRRAAMDHDDYDWQAADLALFSHTSAARNKCALCPRLCAAVCSLPHAVFSKQSALCSLQLALCALQPPDAVCRSANRRRRRHSAAPQTAKI